VSPTPTSVPPTATPVPITTASSLEELGVFIGTQAQQNLNSAGSEAQILQVATQDDGSLLAFVVDEKAEAFDGIALSLAAALYAYHEDPLMPDIFKVLVVDSPSIITGKAKGLGIMKVSDVIGWGEGNIDADEFVARIDFHIE
jgi:hypothetical protein